MAPGITPIGSRLKTVAKVHLNWTKLQMIDHVNPLKVQSNPEQAQVRMERQRTDLENLGKVMSIQEQTATQLNMRVGRDRCSLDQTLTQRGEMLPGTSPERKQRTLKTTERLNLRIANICLLSLQIIYFILYLFIHLFSLRVCQFSFAPLHSIRVMEELGEYTGYCYVTCQIMLEPAL